MSGIVVPVSGHVTVPVGAKQVVTFDSVEAFNPGKVRSLPVKIAQSRQSVPIKMGGSA